MVRTAYALTLLSGLVAGISASPVFRRTIADVITDVNDIKTQVVALSDAVATLNTPTGQTLTNALAIDSSSKTLDTAIKKATTDVDATVAATGAASEADAQQIIDIVNSFKPQIIDTLTTITSLKTVFTSGLGLDSSGLVLTDLTALDTSNQAFENSLIKASPASLASTAEDLAKEIDAAFAPAIAAYGGTAPVRTPPVVTPPSSSAAPASSSVAPPTSSSVEPPTSSSVEPPTSSSVEPPTSSSVEPPTSSSVEPPTSSSVEPPTSSSVEPPVSSVEPPVSSVEPPVSSVAPPASSSVAPPASSTPCPEEPSSTKKPTGPSKTSSKKPTSTSKPTNIKTCFKEKSLKKLIACIKKVVEESKKHHHH